MYYGYKILSLCESPEGFILNKIYKVTFELMSFIICLSSSNVHYILVFEANYKEKTKQKTTNFKTEILLHRRDPVETPKLTINIFD